MAPYAKVDVEHREDHDAVLVSHRSGAGHVALLVAPTHQLAKVLRGEFGAYDELADLLDTLDPETLAAYLQWIEVRERSRGRGVAGKLLDEAIRIAEAASVKVVVLWSAPDEEMDPSRLERLYADHGFDRLPDDDDPLRETVPMVRFL